jgi:hypothetical protein
VPLRAIFGDSQIKAQPSPIVTRNTSVEEYGSMLDGITSLRLAVFAGILIPGSTTSVDIVLVGNIAPTKVKAFIKTIEKAEGREINYSVLSYDEFYYRLSIRDRFITEILNGKHSVVIDKDKILNKE